MPPDGHFPAITKVLARHGIIQSDDSLRERELHKMSGLADALRSGFRARGADALTASIAAELTTTVVGISVGRWLADRGNRPLVDFLRETLSALRVVAA